MTSDVVAAVARDAWRAASHPRAFFTTLDDRPSLRPPLAAAAVSALLGSLVLGVIAARATGSDAWLPFLLGAPLLVLPYLAIVTLLGGLMLMRPAALDLRAFEIVGWAWTPTGLLALSVLPVGLFAPGPTLLGAAVLLPPWHLWVVWRGVEIHAAGGARSAFLLYIAAVFGLPSALLAFTVTVLSNLA